MQATSPTAKEEPRRRRALVSWRRYEKSTPGHHVQIDVKLVDLVTPHGEKLRRFQYTAIDVATRIRALQIYERHNQDSAIDEPRERGLM